MTRQEFVAELQRAIAPDAPPFDEDTQLADTDFWDSVGVLSAMTLIDERLSFTVGSAELSSARRVRDVLILVGEHLDQA